MLQRATCHIQLIILSSNTLTNGQGFVDPAFVGWAERF
jgi:hypothetical protein